MKDYVQYTPALFASIIERLRNGESLNSICSAENMPTRAAFYYWLQDHPELLKAYKKAVWARSFVFRDEIEQFSDPSKVETVIESADGKVSTHSANVALHDNACKWRKYLMGLHAPDVFGDDQALKFNFDANAKPEDQISHIMAQVASGDISLKHAQVLCDLLYKRIDLLKLPELIATIKRIEDQLDGKGGSTVKFSGTEGDSDSDERV